MRVTLKLIAFGICLSCFVLTTLPLYPWLQRDAQRARRYLVLQTSRYARLLRRVLGLRWELRGFEGDWGSTRPLLIVANHLSYVDVILLAAARPCCFVTSQEIRRTPVLGQITALAGCLFVDRKNRSQLGAEVRELSEALRAGLSVVVFPEATSTNGDEVIRFRRPLFQAALDAGAGVLPLTLNYESLDGRPVDAENRDDLCWYGDMSFLPHYLRLAAHRWALVSATVHPVLDEERDLVSLAERAHQQVRSAFRPLGGTNTPAPLAHQQSLAAY